MSPENCCDLFRLLVAVGVIRLIKALFPSYIYFQQNGHWYKISETFQAERQITMPLMVMCIQNLSENSELARMGAECGSDW